MTHEASDAVASGQPYSVLTVAGGEPLSLDQFVGETSFTINKGGIHSDVGGQGMFADSGVRFHEKHDPGGKDVRVWHVTASEDGSFNAASAAVY
jgi:hypothetical protein